MLGYRFAMIFRKSLKNLLQHTHRPQQAVVQNVNLFGGIVEGYRSTDGAWNAEVLHNWLGAVGACAHGNAHFVEKGANVERVGEIGHKRNQRRTLLSGANQSQIADRLDFIIKISE